MKAFSLRFIAAILVMLSGVAVAGAKDLFDDLMKRSDVEVVYVSKALISTVRPNLHVGRIPLGGKVRDIESVYVISSSSKSGVEACERVVEKYVSDNRNLVVLMRSKDGSEQTVLYGLPAASSASGNDEYSQLLIYNSDTNEVSIVLVSGAIVLGGSM